LKDILTIHQDAESGRRRARDSCDSPFLEQLGVYQGDGHGQGLTLVLSDFTETRKTFQLTLQPRILILVNGRGQSLCDMHERQAKYIQNSLIKTASLCTNTARFKHRIAYMLLSCCLSLYLNSSLPRVTTLTCMNLQHQGYHLDTPPNASRQHSSHTEKCLASFPGMVQRRSARECSRH
jgi:hypothetical protein